MNKKSLIASSLVAIVSFIVVLMVYSSLPNTIPTSWGFDGNIQEYSGKSTILWLSFIPFIMIIMFSVLPKIDPRGKNYAKYQGSFSIFAIVMTIFIVIMIWVTILSALGYNIKMPMIVNIMIGILFIIMGNFMPRVRSNYTFGIKTPWTIENEIVWTKTHRMGGVVFVGSGVLFLLNGLFFNKTFSFIPLVLMMIGIFTLYFYSYYVYRQEIKK